MSNAKDIESSMKAYLFLTSLPVINSNIAFWILFFFLLSKATIAIKKTFLPYINNLGMNYEQFQYDSERFRCHCGEIKVTQCDSMLEKYT